MKWLILVCLCWNLVAQARVSFWDTQRKGANFFNEEETRERIRSARKEGVEFIRLTFNKWKPSTPGATTGDFLLGKKGNYKGLIQADLKRLIEVLDIAESEGMKVVITHLSLPGLRWIQHNENKPDNRLWQDFFFHRSVAHFWQKLAKALKGHPAVVGYNLLNEPHPELAFPDFKDWYKGDYDAWYDSVKDTPRDLNLFHESVAEAIRQVDKETPIILDAGFYATPWAFKILRPFKDRNTLYSLHMYEPYAFTSYKNKEFMYPGNIPIGESNPPPILFWNRDTLSRFLLPVREWARSHKIPQQQIIVSEFGTFRGNPGADLYLKDLMELFDSEKWHWAFYSYREDSWAGMDYELGNQMLDGGKKYPLSERQNHYKPNPLMDAIREGLSR